MREISSETGSIHPLVVVWALIFSIPACICGGIGPTSDGGVQDRSGADASTQDAGRRDAGDASEEVPDAAYRSCWQEAPRLNDARAGFGAAATTTAIVVSGGFGTYDGGPFASMTSTEAYLGGEGWVRLGDMNQRRDAHALVSLADGRIMAIGGVVTPINYLNKAQILSSVEILDLDAGTWTVAEPLLSPRLYPGAAVLPDGRVLVVGGRGADGAGPSAQLFDPSNGSWRDAQLPLTAGELDYAVVAVNEAGTALVVGFAPWTFTFDWRTDTWVQSMRSGTTSAISASLVKVGDEFLLAGSFSGSRSERFRPDGGWTPDAVYVRTRYDSPAVVLDGGRILSGSNHEEPTTELYVPEAAIWVPAGRLEAPVARQQLVVWNDRAYSIGGGGPHALATNEVYVFAPDDCPELDGGQP